MHVRSMLVPAAVLALAATVGCKNPQNDTSSTRTTSASNPNTTTTSDTTGMNNNTGTTTTTPGTANQGVGQGSTVGTGTPQGGSTTLSDSDQKFLKKAIDGSVTEISSARHVVQAGSNPEVKSYAQQLVTDHTKASEDLQKLAQQKGVSYDPQMKGDHKDMVDDLSKLAGAQLDKKYTKEMVDDHEKDVKDFRDAAKDVKDPDLRAWAQKQVPILETHLTKAKELEKKVK